MRIDLIFNSLKIFFEQHQHQHQLTVIVPIIFLRRFNLRFYHTYNR